MNGWPVRRYCRCTRKLGREKRPKDKDEDDGSG